MPTIRIIARRISMFCWRRCYASTSMPTTSLRIQIRTTLFRPAIRSPTRPVPVAAHSLGSWKCTLFGDLYACGRSTAEPTHYFMRLLLEIHAMEALEVTPGRKRSWIGYRVDEKPAVEVVAFVLKGPCTDAFDQVILG